MKHLVLLKDRKGQSIVEISLITPLLLLALYVPIDFGMAMYQGHLTQNAVREVARIAATQAPTAFDSNALATELTNRLPKYVTVSGTPSITKFKTGSANCLQVVTVSVTVNYPFTWYKFARLFRITTANALQITRSTRMWYEYQPYSSTNTPCTAA